MNEVIRLMAKTVVTTIDILICGVVIMLDKTGNRKMQASTCLFMLLNLAGIWI